MNNIKKIALATNEWFEEDGHSYSRDAWNEKFAELIIEDCIYKISNEQDMADQNWQCKNGVHIAHKLKEHFGIKE